MLRDAHLLKAATPTVNTGNRIGRKCQEATTALGARVVWVDGFVLMSWCSVEFMQADAPIPCSVKYTLQPESDTPSNRADVFTTEISSRMNVGLCVR
jgi:hypothetical protein